ncbi:MAG: ABC transporter substrate-binding protein [Myxococcales bacterium]|nr:ABC transporter substrate-binding protein [Myxococcales bacterium]
MKQRARWAVVVGALTVLAVSSVASAQSQDPRQWVVTRYEAVQRVLRQPGAPGSPEATARNAQASRLLNGMIDVEALGRRALDTQWEGRSAEERQEFVGLLRQLIERSYRQHLDQTLNYNITYVMGDRDDAAGTATVRSTARSRSDARAAAVNIEYRMQRRTNGWMVYDIVTNGSSLVETYRESYTRIVRERGFAELLRRLRQRVAAST